MNLLVDIGNSRLKWNIYNSHTQRFLAEMNSVAYDSANFQAILDDQWTGIEAIKSIVIANVAGERVQQVVSQWAQKHWQITPYFVQTESHKFGVENAYPQSRQLGVDRWVALLAAKNLSQSQPVCAVDCGTAITVDTVSEHGSHLGGLIIPGLELMNASLSQKTHGINVKNSFAELNLFAHNTYDGVNNGIYYAVISYIDGIVGQIEDTLGRDVHKVITGGDAPIILPHLSRNYHHIPDLVLQGLVLYLD